LRKEENILWSFAPHDISVILRLVGQPPTRVRAMGGDWVTPGVHDVTVTHLEFPGGVRCHIFVSWLHPHKEQRLVVTGDRSVMVFEDSALEPERKLRKYAHRVEWIKRAPVAHKAPEELISFPPNEPLKLECQAFLDAIESREEPLTSGRKALEVLRVLEASQQSLLAGSTWIEMDHGPEGIMKPFVHESAVIDEGVYLGENTRVWHNAHISNGARIEANCVLGQNVFVAPNVEIGKGVRIQNNVSVYAGVVLEDDVFVGPSAVFTNVKTPRSHVSRKEEFTETRVGRQSTIGANATIVCGVSIGHHALVGAGAVVTRDVAPHQVVYGNPACVQGWACRCGEVLSEELQCARCGDTYQRNEAGLERVS
jgi:UDP-2-acetamido-3-amino-2,3-dideoxy-glucuronate N-acetyltransferase